MSNIIHIQNIKSKQKLKEELKNEILKKKHSIKLNYFELFCLISRILDSIIIGIDLFLIEFSSDQPSDEKEMTEYTIENSIKLLKKFYKYNSKFNSKIFKLDSYIIDDLIIAIEPEVYLSLYIYKNAMYDIEFLEGLQMGNLNNYIEGIYLMLKDYMKTIDKN